MKNVVIWGAVAIVLLAGAYWYFNQDAVTENNATSAKNEDTVQASSDTLETGTYKVDTEKSRVVWRAGKPAISGYVHTGEFSLSDGEFTLDNSSLKGDTTIDMNSLHMISLGGGKAGQESTLEGHLKGERFFNVAAYPTASFRLTDISPKVLPGPDQKEYTATGELTMKGTTKTITFPLKVTVVSPREAQMTASFSIDRTEWGITSGSAKVTEVITDQIIGDTVEIELSALLVK